VRVVDSFQELVKTHFSGDVNALCWPRSLPGNFAEVAEHLTGTDDITSLDEAMLHTLPLSPEGRTAVGILVEDLERLRGQGLAPVLDCVRRYPRDEDSRAVPTDVYSFHADSAPVETDTYLCSYTEAASEGLRNDEAQRYIDQPETRARLLREFGGEESADFQDYLQSRGYDLHYAPQPTARPFDFGLGHLWRIAVDYPGSPVPPCVHRAPATRLGRPPRLLLIS
jgi:hypothetical protein